MKKLLSALVINTAFAAPAQADIIHRISSSVQLMLICSF